MRTTETPPQAASFPPVSAPSTVPAVAETPPSPPSQVSLGDRLKAVGLVALVGTLGLGAMLAARELWDANRDEALVPLPGDTETRRDRQAPIRDRVRVLSPRKSAISPPETSPDDRARQPFLRSPSQVPEIRTSFGFGEAAEVEEDLEENLEPDMEAEAEAPPEDAPETPLAEQPEAPTAPAKKPASPAIPEVITALLEPPQFKEPGAIATAPPPPDRFEEPDRPIARPVNPMPPPGETPDQPPAQPVGATPASGTTSDTDPDSSTGTVASPDEEQPVAIVQPPPESIYVERLAITGSTRFSQRELAEVIQRTIPPTEPPSAPARDDLTLLNRRLTPAELVQISEAITKLYTERGYINSGAYVPAGVLTGEPPEIRVVEGRVEAINVQVQPPRSLWLAQPLSRSYVRGRLARSLPSPLQLDQLVDAVKLLEQDPLIDSITTELAPGTTTGGSILNVNVRQAPPLQPSFSLDNSRSPSVGRFRQVANLSHANLLGLGDRLQIGFNRSSGSRGWDFGYVLPINSSNGTLSFNYSQNRGEVIEDPFQELDIESRSRNFEIALRQPLWQSSTEEFALSLRGTHYRNEGVFLESFNNGDPLPFPAQGSDPDGKTRITALRFGQEWLRRGERNVFFLQSEFSLGINALGATQLETPPDGRFFAWQGQGFWVRSLGPDTLLAVKGKVQFANRPLVPVEQLSLGGIDTVRGYRTSALLADSGWFASAEVYLPILRVPEWQGVLQVIPFFDVGQGWNRGDDEPAPDRLMSAGVGVQWKLGDNFRARLDWGFPLINSETEGGRSLREGLFFSVTFSP